VAEHPAARFVEHEVAQGFILAIQRDCSHTVAPGGGATPPTITSLTSPSAWQLTTWMTFDERMLCSLLCLSGPHRGESRTAMGPQLLH
jgi:hypothetical protein